jgi:hypothetical protein
MAKLDIGRMQNSTQVRRVDDAHNALEEALELIFGIPDNTEITRPIFDKINPDGSATGVVRLTSTSPPAGADDAVGLEFYDGDVKKKIAFVGGVLRLYVWSDETSTWTIVANLEAPASGRLVDLADCTEIKDADLSQSIGMLVKVNNSGNGFSLQESATVDGINLFTELQDCPGTLGSKGQIVVVDQSGTGLTFDNPPAGASGPFIMFLKTDLSSGISVGSGLGTWDSIANWRQLWAWTLYDPSNSGIPVTDNSTYLASDGGSANRFIKNLSTGLYSLDFYYEVLQASPETIFGARAFSIAGTNISVLSGTVGRGYFSGAEFGVNGSSQAGVIYGTRHIGSLKFIVTGAVTDATIRFFQDSGAALKAIFYTIITKVK